MSYHAYMARKLRARDFGGRLKTWRLSKDLTQEQAAKILDVAVQQLSRWETGANKPGIERCEEIANEIGVTAAYLAYGQ